jgi:hypothetical protein
VPGEEAKREGAGKTLPPIWLSSSFEGRNQVFHKKPALFVYLFLRANSISLEAISKPQIWFKIKADRGGQPQ